MLIGVKMSNMGKLLPYLFLLFTIGFGWFILSPLIPLLISAFGIKLAYAIQLISLYGYTMVILGLLAGWMSAKFTVKLALYLAAAISIIGLIGRALSPDYAVLLVFQVIAAIAYPLAMAPVGSVAASLFKNKSHTVVGISVGVLFLGMAAGAFSGPSLSAALGLSGTFWVTAILAVIAAIWIFFGIKGYPTNYKGKSLKGSFKWGMLKNWYVGLVISSASVMFGGIASTVLLDIHHFSVLTAIGYGGLLGGLAFLGSAFGAIMLPPIFEKYKQIRMGMVLTGILSFIFVVSIAYYLSFIPLIAVLILSFFLFGFFGNAFWSMAMASTTNYVSDPAKAGFATSMYSVATNLGVAFVPVFLGPVFIKNASLAVGVVVVIEFVALLMAFLMKTKAGK